MLLLKVFAHESLEMKKGKQTLLYQKSHDLIAIMVKITPLLENPFVVVLYLYNPYNSFVVSFSL
jgi:hypothetical protein